MVRGSPPRVARVIAREVENHVGFDATPAAIAQVAEARYIRFVRVEFQRVFEETSEATVTVERLQGADIGLRPISAPD